MIKAAMLTLAIIAIGSVAVMLGLFWLADWCFTAEGDGDDDTDLQ
jgi:preprotein translocase subunit SecE